MSSLDLPCSSVFLIADIVHIIIAYLPGDATRAESLSCLARCARVSTIWRDIALRELWSTRGSWKHIFPILGPMRENSLGKKVRRSLSSPFTLVLIVVIGVRRPSRLKWNSQIQILQSLRSRDCYVRTARSGRHGLANSSHPPASIPPLPFPQRYSIPNNRRR